MAFSPERILDSANSLSVKPALDPHVDRRLKQAREGRIDTVGNVSLDVAPATTTTVTHPAVSSTSFVGLEPTNALATVAKPLVTPGNGLFTITHTTSASARTYRFVIFTPAVA